MLLKISELTWVVLEAAAGTAPCNILDLGTKLVLMLRMMSWAFWFSKAFSSSNDSLSKLMFAWVVMDSFSWLSFSAEVKKELILSFVKLASFSSCLIYLISSSKEETNSTAFVLGFPLRYDRSCSELRTGAWLHDRGFTAVVREAGLGRLRMKPLRWRSGWRLSLDS